MGGTAATGASPSKTERGGEWLVIEEVRNAFVEACLSQYEQQGPEGHQRLSEVLGQIGRAIQAYPLGLDWLKKGVMDKCIVPVDPFNLGELPANLVRNSEEFKLLEAAHENLLRTQATEEAELTAAIEKVQAARDAEREQIVAWRAAQATLLELQATANQLSASKRKTVACLAWHRDALASAKEAATPTRLGPPVPAAGSLHGVPSVGSGSSPSEQAPPTKRTAIERLTEAKQLLDANMISKAEFDAMRAAILAGI